MSESRTIILDHQKVQQKLKRIAYQIYEFNYDEKEIVMVGIEKRGYLVAERLQQMVREISDINVKLVKLEIDKDDPLNSAPVLHAEQGTLENKSVFLIDDVLNSGRTLMYAACFVINRPVKKLTTAVLVDRKHRKFPIKADFVGLSLSTTIQDHISVEFGEDQDKVFLE